MSSFQALKERRAARHTLSHAVDRAGAPSVSLPAPSEAEHPRQVPESALTPVLSEPISMSSPSEASGSVAPASKVNAAFGMDGYGVRIERRKGRGRGVFASRAFKPGDTIYSITARPPTSALSTPNLTTHCSGCFLSAKDGATLRRVEEVPLKRCSACRVAHYCSTACSRDDWVYHKPECTAFQILRKKHKEKTGGQAAGSLDFVPYESVRALGRLLWTRKRAKDTGQECQAWEEFTLLQSQIDPEGESIQQLRHEAYRLAFYVGLTSRHLLEVGGEAGLALLMKEIGVEGNPELALMKIWSKYQTNAFTLDSPDLSALGAVVAPALAMANHSCEPNAVVVFPHGQAKGQITAIRPIREDDEVLVCYIDVASPRSVRQADLTARYGFTCDCASCERDNVGDWVDPRWSLSHPGCEKRGIGRMPTSVQWDRVTTIHTGASARLDHNTKNVVTASRCQGCHGAFSVDETELMDLLSRAEGLLIDDEKGSLDMSDSGATGLLRTAQDVASRLSRLCPPSAHPLIPLQRLITRLLTIEPPTSLQALSVPLYHLNLALEGARAVYAPHHPTIAILLAQKARLLGIRFPPSAEEVEGVRAPGDMRSEIQRMQAAMLAYREAVRTCSGCFGSDGGAVGIGLRAEMESLEMEMRAMRMGAESARPT